MVIEIILGALLLYVIWDLRATRNNYEYHIRYVEDRTQSLEHHLSRTQKYNEMLYAIVVDLLRGNIDTIDSNTNLLESLLQQPPNVSETEQIRPFDMALLGLTESDILALFQGNVEYDEHGNILI